MPGVDAPPGWDDIPGARGCTPQSCSFRDHFAELKRLGVAQLYGLSTQDTGYQREAAARLHLPFAILSEPMKLAHALGCRPSRLRHDAAQAHGLVIDDGVITKVFYPVFPPDKSAADVIAGCAAAADAGRLSGVERLAQLPNTSRNISGVSTPVLVL